MRNRNIFWGLFFLCAGGLVILGQFDYFEVNVFRLMWSALFIVFALSNIPKRNWFFVVIPIALVVWYNRDLLLISEYLSFWPLMFAGILVSVGLSLLIKKKWKGSYSYYQGEKHQNMREETRNQNDDVVYCGTNLASSAQYLHSSNLQEVHANCSLGSLQVYFDQATPSVNGVRVDVRCDLGKVELYIPHDWKVINNVSTSLASVVESHYNAADTIMSSVVVNIEGRVTMGEVEIIYV